MKGGATYRLLYNMNFARLKFDGYKMGDQLVSSVEYAIEFAELPHDMEAVLEIIFARHNRDDRPNPLTEPSLSAGDVVKVTVVRGDEKIPTGEGEYTVKAVGFESVFVEDDDIAREVTVLEYMKGLESRLHS